jgi:hypothetical protein
MTGKNFLPLLAMVFTVGLTTGLTLAGASQAQASTAQATEADTSSTHPCEGSLADRLDVPGDPLPRVLEYHNSGCKRDADEPCSEDDEILLTVEGNTLYLLHRNATYNCCPDEIAISLMVQGTTLMLTEEEVLTIPCDCNCCYDVEATIVDLAPDSYTVQFCWFDYEIWSERCDVQEIEVPTQREARSGSAPSPDAGTTAQDRPEVPGKSPSTGADPVPLTPPVPHVADQQYDGCLRDEDLPCPDPDAFILTVEGSTLHVLHESATYNCCLDEITITLSMEGDILKLTEEEIVTLGCWCICCYEAEATIVDLAPGIYTVEFYWFDYETWQEQCYVEEIVIE